jgi:hypothetical protein
MSETNRVGPASFLFAVTVVASVAGSGCSAEVARSIDAMRAADDDPCDASSGVVDPSDRDASNSTATLVAATALGELVMFDAQGRPRSSPSAPLASRGARLHLTVRAWAHERGELVALCADADDEVGSRAFIVEARASAFGAPREAGSVGGLSRIFPTPEGLVTATYEFGARWSLERGPGGPVPSEACGRPLSLGRMLPTDEGTHVRAFARWPSDEPSILDVHLGSDRRIECTARALTGVHLDDPEPRWIDLGDERSLALHIDDGRVRVESLNGLASVGSSLLGVEAERIADAKPISDRFVALHVDGPPRLVLAGVVDGEGLVLAGMRELRSAADATDGWLGRSLAVVGGRIFVAESGGLEAFDVEESDAGVDLRALELSHDVSRLRAPIVVAHLGDGNAGYDHGHARASDDLGDSCD